MVLEAGIDGESLIGSLTRASPFPLLPHIDSSSLQRPYPECATPGKLAFGRSLADVLVQHIRWFRLASVDEPTDFLSFPCVIDFLSFPCVPDVPDPKRAIGHISCSHEPSSTYQQCLVDLFSCFVDLFTWFLLAFGLQHENRHKPPEVFTNGNKKIYGPFGAKPHTAPPLPPLSVCATSSTRNSNCPICDRMLLPHAAGGHEFVTTHSINNIPEEHAQMICWNPFLWSSVI